MDKNNNEAVQIAKQLSSDQFKINTTAYFFHFFSLLWKSAVYCIGLLIYITVDASRFTAVFYLYPFLYGNNMSWCYIT